MLLRLYGGQKKCTIRKFLVAISTLSIKCAAMLRELIKAYQKQNNLSIRAMASQIGLDHTILFRWMNGHELITNHWIVLIKWVLLNEGTTAKKEQNAKEAR